MTRRVLSGDQSAFMKTLLAFACWIVLRPLPSGWIASMSPSGLQEAQPVNVYVTEKAISVPSGDHLGRSQVNHCWIPIVLMQESTCLTPEPSEAFITSIAR